MCLHTECQIRHQFRLRLNRCRCFHQKCRCLHCHCLRCHCLCCRHYHQRRPYCKPWLRCQGWQKSNSECLALRGCHHRSKLLACRCGSLPAPAPIPTIQSPRSLLQQMSREESFRRPESGSQFSGYRQVKVLSGWVGYVQSI